MKELNIDHVDRIFSLRKRQPLHPVIYSSLKGKGKTLI